jgi:hypothetical protein
MMGGEDEEWGPESGKGGAHMCTAMREDNDRLVIVG